MSDVETIQVAPAEADVRLDRWFGRRFPQVSHGHLQKLLRTGQIRVDGRRAKANERLHPGQRIRVPPLPAASPPPAAAPPSDADVAMIRARVIYRDDALLAIDKPQGLAVQGGTGQARHVDRLLDALRFDAPERPRLVHRLDKDTSGVLLLARSAEAATKLGEAFHGGKVEKIYWAVCVGVPKPRQGRLSLPLAKGGMVGGERMMKAGDGKPAITDYRVIDAASRHASWLELRPRTGRTHQLRVHCEALGTPILGDGKYGGPAAFLEGMATARSLHLQARAIILPDWDGRERRIVAPLSPHMRDTFKALGFEIADGAALG